MAQEGEITTREPSNNRSDIEEADSDLEDVEFSDFVNDYLGPLSAVIVTASLSSPSPVTKDDSDHDVDAMLYFSESYDEGFFPPQSSSVVQVEMRIMLG